MRKAEVTFDFNGVLVTVTDESVTDDIVQVWRHAKRGQSVGPHVSDWTLDRLKRLDGAKAKVA